MELDEYSQDLQFISEFPLWKAGIHEKFLNIYMKYTVIGLNSRNYSCVCRGEWGRAALRLCRARAELADWRIFLYNNSMADVIIMGDECAGLMTGHVCCGSIHSVFDKVINIETCITHTIDSLFSVCVRSVPPAPARIIADTETSWLLQDMEPGQEFSITCDNAPVWHRLDDYTLSMPGEIMRRVSEIQIPENDALKGIAYNDVYALIGRGPGLTPSGDDFLTGVLYSLHFLGCNYLLECLSKKVKNLLDRTTRLSRHFLKYALAGKWGQTEQDVLLALMTDTGGDLNKAVDNLLAVGSSSGADELSGIVAGIYAALEKQER